MLIGLTGYAGAGKDTAAAYLIEHYGFERRAFADKLRELAYEQDPWLTSCGLRYAVDSVGWDRAKRGDSQIREYLQDAGQAHRKVFGKDFWVDQVLPSTLGVPGWLRRARIVVTDCRYPNEARRIRSLGGVIVRITRSDVGPVNDHASEQPLAAEHVFVNVTGDPGHLYVQLRNLINTMEGQP